MKFRRYGDDEPEIVGGPHVDGRRVADNGRRRRRRGTFGLVESCVEWERRRARGELTPKEAEAEAFRAPPSYNEYGRNRAGGFMDLDGAVDGGMYSDR